MIEIGEGYSIDAEGNVYGKRGFALKPFKKGGYVFICFGETTKSLARVVACFLVDNPNNYQKIRYKDGNKYNCHPSNLEWISDEEYEFYHLQCKMRNRKFSFQEAKQKSKCPILKAFYSTGDFSIINRFFEDLDKKITVDYWPQVSGLMYLRVHEKLTRGVISDSLERYIKGSLKHLRNADPSEYTYRGVSETIHQ